jgi:hypothetical protein
MSLIVPPPCVVFLTLTFSIGEDKTCPNRQIGNFLYFPDRFHSFCVSVCIFDLACHLRARCFVSLVKSYILQVCVRISISYPSTPLSFLLSLSLFLSGRFRRRKYEVLCVFFFW